MVLLQLALVKIAAAKDSTKVKNPGDSQFLVKVTPTRRTPTCRTPTCPGDRLCPRRTSIEFSYVLPF